MYLKTQENLWYNLKGHTSRPSDYMTVESDLLVWEIKVRISKNLIWTGQKSLPKACHKISSWQVWRWRCLWKISNSEAGLQQGTKYLASYGIYILDKEIFDKNLWFFYKSLTKIHIWHRDWEPNFGMISKSQC